MQDEDIDLVVLALPGGADPNIEIVGTRPAELVHTTGALVAIADDVVDNAKLVTDAKRLATLLGAQLVGGAAAAKVVAPTAIVDKSTPLAPELCVVIGNATVDLSGSTSVIKIGASADKTIDGALPAPPAVSLASLVKHLEDV